MKSAFSLAAAISLSCLLGASGAARAVADVPETVMPEKTALVLTLEKAVDGLEMPSETDAPFEVVFFEMPAENATETPLLATPLSTEQIAKLVGAPDDAELETRDLDEFFENAAVQEDWMNDEEKATASRFAALLETLKTQLKDVQVLVWGDAKKNVAIIGKCEGGAAGVITLVVET